MPDNSHPQPAGPPTGPQVDSPQQPNRIWRSLRWLLRNVFVFWLSYRARGLSHLPPQGAALLLINHQSYLDPLLVGLPLQRPVSFLARHDLFTVPVIGWILRNTYVLPINRDAAGADSLRELVRRLAQGFYVGIFPEGTRTRDGRLAALRPGFISVIRRSHVPVIPVGIAGGSAALPRGAIWLRPRLVRVVVGEPLPSDELRLLSERGREAELVERVRMAMEAVAQEAERWRLEAVGASSEEAAAFPRDPS
jgi:1-acyl-sn-glycerol-3-phosphate acyltransferase